MIACWKGFKDEKDISETFDVCPELLDGIEVLYALNQPIYCADTVYILFIKNGILYEVSGTHDSYNCYEEQWDPEETTVEAILLRDTWYSRDPDLKNILRQL